MKRFLPAAVVIALVFFGSGIELGKLLQERADKPKMFVIPAPERRAGAVAFRPYVCMVYVDSRGNDLPSECPR